MSTNRLTLRKNLTIFGLLNETNIKEIMKRSNTLLILLVIFMGINLDVNAQDWANLNRFKEDNAKLGMPKTCEDRVVFMGNSITQGWITNVPEFFSGRWYINRGIGGQTTPQMLVRFRQDVINLYPKVVVILAGTNDIAGNTGPSTLEMIEDNLYSMTELAQAHGIQVVLCSILPVYDYPWRTGLEPAPKIMELNKRIKEYARTHGVVYCDFFSEMADERNGLPVELSGDGVHPNKDGYAIMAPIVERAIAQALLMWKGFK